MKHAYWISVWTMLIAPVLYADEYSDVLERLKARNVAVLPQATTSPSPRCSCQNPDCPFGCDQYGCRCCAETAFWSDCDENGYYWLAVGGEWVAVWRPEWPQPRNARKQDYGTSRYGVAHPTPIGFPCVSLRAATSGSS